MRRYFATAGELPLYNSLVNIIRGYEKKRFEDYSDKSVKRGVFKCDTT